MRLLAFVLLSCVTTVAPGVFAHDLSADNAAFVQSLTDSAPGPFLYLGAKHMFTGYDHLLFLFGVLFFLYRARDVILLVTLFTLGHSLTLMLGVWLAWQIDSHLIDAIIGLSIVYKAFDNLGGFERVMGLSINPVIAVFAFGLCHGLGLATRLQDYIDQQEGLFTNLLSFNLGVELGQLAALSLILLFLLHWRASPRFSRQAFGANVALMCAGFTLAGYQFAGYLLT